ncbi:hypothetical protein TorRG33x02_256240 [Trema orientale]|uniref:Uncharacterized protein n=1 Tax=Trema orientale TaxID=63057 RepID=A0A2P5DBM8_TREOI|nr:hypothetical protein TorRG33x02_256240 [Trema orientale]
MGLCLSQEVLYNAFLDLNPIGYEGGGTSTSANSKPSTESLSQPSRKKRKRGSTAGFLEEGLDGSLEVVSQKSQPTTLLSLRIAALEALEALLTVGGASRSKSDLDKYKSRLSNFDAKFEHWLLNLDLHLINIVESSSKGGWASEERNIIQSNEGTESWVNVQLAALQTLLASFLSSRFHPQHLAQGLELFRRGKQETGTKLAEFCAHALLALEVFIHPRALSVDDFPTANFPLDDVHHEVPLNIYSDRLKHRTPFSSGTKGREHYAPHLDDHVHHEYLMGDGEETEAAVSDPVETIYENKNPSETLSVREDIKLSGDGSNKEIPEGNKQEPEAADADVEIQDGGDELMAESHQLPESKPLSQDSVSAKFSSVANTDGSTGSQRVFERITSGASKQDDNDMALCQDISVAKSDVFTTIGTSSTLDSEMDHESDSEEYPELVDVSTHSDTDEEDE